MSDLNQRGSDTAGELSVRQTYSDQLPGSIFQFVPDDAVDRDEFMSRGPNIY